MLYDRKQMGRDQLLSDLTALKARLTMPEGWLKGGFGTTGGVCIVQAAKIVTDHVKTGGGFIPIESGTERTKDIRLGRIIVAIYRTLKGPKADLKITVQQAQSAIASFNDATETTLDAVCLLIDRAIAMILEPLPVGGDGWDANDKTSGADFIKAMAGEPELVTA